MAGSLHRTPRERKPLSEDHLAAADGALARLLAAEARLEQMLADRRADAEREVEAARVRAREVLDGLDAELAAEARVTAGQEERRRAEAVARLETASARALARWRAVDGPEVERLADWVVRQVIDGVAAAPPPRSPP